LVVNFKNCSKNLIPCRTGQAGCHGNQKKKLKKTSLKKTKELELKYLA
jgi:hypothetical protein